MDGLIAYALAKKYADKVGQSILDAGFKVRVEQDRSILNRTGEQMILYLLPKESSLSSDTYDEYVYTNKWEQVGSTDIDLSGYQKKISINQTDYLNFGGWDGNTLTVKSGLFKRYTFRSKQNPTENDIQGLDFNTICYIPQQYAQFLPDNAYGEIATFAVITESQGTLLTQILFGINGNVYVRHGEYGAHQNSFNSWQEIGGSEIASAAVNQDGTITFYDKDGNPLFTTTGSSVIGPQGAPGQDYVLTNQDKTDIANIVLQLLPNADTMLFPEVSEVNNG